MWLLLLILAWRQSCRWSGEQVTNHQCQPARVEQLEETLEDNSDLTVISSVQCSATLPSVWDIYCGRYTGPGPGYITKLVPDSPLSLLD